MGQDRLQDCWQCAVWLQLSCKQLGSLLALVIPHQPQVLPPVQRHHPPVSQDCATGGSGRSPVPLERGVPAAGEWEAEPPWLAGGGVGLLLNLAAR